MAILISMLRGINVGGHNKIKMEELRKVYESLGFQNITTYVQSGNVLFTSNENKIEKIAESIEQQIKNTFAFSVSVIIRERKDFQNIIQINPFLIGRNEDPVKLYVTFLSKPVPALKIDNLKVPESGNDEFFIMGKEIFLFCPDGYGRTKLSNNFFEKKLNVVATTRNWKSVITLYKMASDLEKV